MPTSANPTLPPHPSTSSIPSDSVDSVLSSQTLPDSANLSSHTPTSQTIPLTVTVLIDALNRSSTRIVDALKSQEFEAAITTKAEGTEDPRFDDVLAVSAKSMTGKARRTLAQRSLAEEYRSWRRNHTGIDLINSLMLKPHARFNQDSAKEFLGTKSQRPSVTSRPMITALRHGVKMLLLEQQVESFTTSSLNIPTSVISAIMNFQHSHFVKVDRGDLKVLCEEVLKSRWMMLLMREHPNWLETCQNKYDGKHVYVIPILPLSLSMT